MTTIVSPISARLALVAGVYATLFQVPAGANSATVNARILTHDLTTDIKVRMAVCPSTYNDGDVPTNDDWIQPIDLKLGPTGISVGIIEDTAIVLAPGEKLVVCSDTAATARAHGFLKTIS